jgi:hypothetical protein
MNMWKYLGCLIVAGTMAMAQTPGEPAGGRIAQRRAIIGAPGPGSGSAEAEKDLPRFDLDFPGGTPSELVEAIRKEIETLNAIIPEKDRADRIPAFKVKGVTVPELFRALKSASMRTVTHQTGVVDYGGAPGNRRSILQQTPTQSGFETFGAPTREAVWYYSASNEPKLQATVCRFYQLAPYLGTYKVEDITTAVQAGWKMLGEKDTPQLNYHEDTKLLIAVGSPDKLEMIDAALLELTKGKPKPEALPTGTTKP